MKFLPLVTSSPLPATDRLSIDSQPEKKRLLKFWGSVFLQIYLSSIAFTQTSSRTAEDSLSSGALLSRTIVGGYGSASYQNDVNAHSATMNLDRVVLFIGHSFGEISFFSELEVEDAKVSGGEDGGEVAFEQAYLKFDLDQHHYVAAGLFLPRIGILNENHLPNEFNGTERNQVETYILPSTWRELGVGFYGELFPLPFSYSVAIVNGLNSASFEHGTGIREGRFEGRNAAANNLALNGSLQFYTGNLKAQVSGYYGGSIGLPPRQADGLQLASGMFGTPVIIGEADAQFEQDGFSLKTLGAIVSIPNAFQINRAYGSNTPKSEYGVYGEIAYDFLHRKTGSDRKKLVAFVRYESLDLNASIPDNGTLDKTLRQNHTILGLSYHPMGNVVIKGDARFAQVGGQNPVLTINPNPDSEPFAQNSVFINFGIGYSF